MGELCENEALWFEKLAEGCRKRAQEGRSWNDNDEESQMYKALFTLHDLPTRPGWEEHAKYLDRRAAAAWKSARRFGSTEP